MTHLKVKCPDCGCEFLLEKKVFVRTKPKHGVPPFLYRLWAGLRVERQKRTYREKTVPLKKEQAEWLKTNFLKILLSQKRWQNRHRLQREMEEYQPEKFRRLSLSFFNIKELYDLVDFDKLVDEAIELKKIREQADSGEIERIDEC